MVNKKITQLQRYSPKTHGLFIQLGKVKIDGRTKLGKTIAFLRKEFTNHLGGNLNICERILVDRAISKVIKSQLYELGFLENPDQKSRDHYLALANSLRLDLQALGIKRRGGEVMDLGQYLKTKIEVGEQK